MGAQQHLSIIQSRVCGACTVCCDFVSIAELNKPARVPCVHLGEGDGGRCTIYERADRPAVCGRFLCSWRRGFGSEGDRPDLIGAMVSVNEIPGESSLFGLVVEIRPNAVVGDAASMIAAVATNTKLPIIISDYESLPPNDKGNRVAIHTSILYRSRRMIGPLLNWLAPDVALYELIRGAP